MKIKKILFLLCLYFFPLISWSQTQYAPLASIERHELSASFSISKKAWQTSRLRKLPVFALKYALFLPEISNFSPEPYNKFFTPGFSAGLNLFRKQSHTNYELCESTNQNHFSAAYHFGLKGKIPYFEFLQPFAELGLARSFCYSRYFSNFFKAKKTLQHYFSYGFSLSLKILDKISIYTLDQDHGINDIGIKTECIHYYPKNKENKPFSFCQFGLQVSF